MAIFHSSLETKVFILSYFEVENIFRQCPEFFALLYDGKPNPRLGYVGLGQVGIPYQIQLNQIVTTASQKERNLSCVIILLYIQMLGVQ